jgi:hypothetical protein
MMSDPIAQAAEALSAAPSSTEPLVVQAVAEQPVPAVIAPAIVPVTGNVLVNAAPVVGEQGNVQVAVQSGTAVNSAIAEPVASQPSSASQSVAATELPRESHLMLLEHKLAAMHAKFKTGERIVVDEFEQILGHIRAVL